MENVFDYFKDVIDRMRTSGLDSVPKEALIALTGAIDYAVGRGDLTIVQAERLDDSLGGIRSQYADAFEIATFGDLGAAEPAN